MAEFGFFLGRFNQTKKKSYISFSSKTFEKQSETINLLYFFESTSTHLNLNRDSRRHVPHSNVQEKGPVV